MDLLDETAELLGVGVRETKDPIAQHLVAHVITGLNTGGAEMMLFKLLSRWRYERQGARVISLNGDGLLRGRIESLGVPVDSLDMRRGLPSVGALRRLRRIAGGIDAAVIQGWMYHGNLAAIVTSWLRRGGIPVVWSVRQTLYDLRRERRLTRWVIRANALLSSRVDAIVYNSRTSARQHESIGFDGTRSRIIPNGFDTETFRPDPMARAEVRREVGAPDDAILIGLIARYHPMKDHAMFLQAAALLAREYPNVRFLLAGTDVRADTPALRAMIAEHGLWDRISLLGERADTPRLNAALDIASSSSAWGEGFANVVGEAMSCGVPCVVTDIGDSAWIVGDTGMVCPPGDPRAMAAGWAQLVSLGRNGRAALGALARKRVIANFSLEPIVTQYQDLYESVMARAGT
jgi:glycosyltransferase involved in cell wall biosynthesis